MNLENKYIFLSLVGLGIGHNTFTLTDEQCKTIDWKEIQVIAMQQGLAAIVIDGIETLPETLRPPKGLLLEWIGQVLQEYEHRYELYRRAIAEMASFYNAHDLKMMVLKGYSCSLDWPKPEHRPAGDIDIWLFGEYKKADALITKEKGIKVNTDEHHHTVFYWKGFMVENHFDFINVHHHKSNVQIEKVLKSLGEDDSHFVDILGEKVYIPSPNLHALFLLRHAIIEFAACGLNFRQVLDWAFFVRKHGDKVDWEWLYSVLDEFHMREFFNAINAICVENLGFDSKDYPYILSSIKEKVLNDLFYPDFDGGKPPKLLSRIIWKIRRWKANKWKHQLCYNESMWSTFWCGVWSHLLKPSSI